jgi:hypothetical protein
MMMMMMMMMMLTMLFDVDNDEDAKDYHHHHQSGVDAYQCSISHPSTTSSLGVLACSLLFVR